MELITQQANAERVLRWFVTENTNGGFCSQTNSEAYKQAVSDPIVEAIKITWNYAWSSIQL